MMEYRGLFLGILIAMLAISAAHALEIKVYVDGVDITDLDTVKIGNGMHNITAELNGDFPIRIINYSIDVKPDNIFYLMQKFGMKPNATLNLTVYEPITHEVELKIPKDLCGLYTGKVIYYYVEGENVKKGEIAKAVEIPCPNVKTKLLYIILAVVPKPILDYALKFIGIGLR